jgi:hypothetical protein
MDHWPKMASFCALEGVTSASFDEFWGIDEAVAKGDGWLGSQAGLNWGVGVKSGHCEESEIPWR